MRITSQNNVELPATKNLNASISVETKPVEKTEIKKSVQSSLPTETSLNSKQSKERELAKAELDQAVDTMNELIDTTKKATKFVLHDGLDKYYVRLVNSETEEVIKEIPPERLLDAFYEMQKLAGMIVDEKI